MKKEVDSIELKSLLKYYILFIIPVLISFFVAWKTSTYFGPKLNMSPAIFAQLVMIFFSFVTFSILVPYVRKREETKGVRYALIGFVLFSLFLTLPSIIKGYWGMILIQFLYLANYILLTFIFCPEVLGIHHGLEEWFHKSKQVSVLVIYLLIVILYCAGFAWVFHQLATDPIYTNAFDMGLSPSMSYGAFFYFSVITFAAIGYGDIAPISEGARLVSCVEGIMGMVINVVFIAILFMYISNVQTLFHKSKQLARADTKLKNQEKELEEQVNRLEKKGHTKHAKKVKKQMHKIRRSRIRQP